MIAADEFYSSTWHCFVIDPHGDWVRLGSTLGRESARDFLDAGLPGTRKIVGVQRGEEHTS